MRSIIANKLVVTAERRGRCILDHEIEVPMIDIREMSIEELEGVVEELDEPKFRAKQIFEWLHKHNVSDYDKMTNLSKSLRSKLAETYPLSEAEQVLVESSGDGTRKYVLELEDGATVETVGMPVSFDEKGNKIKRLTVCFSSQAGCPMECTFCATGREGFIRNLTASEIVEQVLAVQEDFATPVSNVVAMGQGEPFLNYDNLLGALRRINTDPGLNIGARKITVSTCGVIEGIKRFGREPEQFRLAVSLHSARQRTRDQLMPKLANQPLDHLQQALIEYNHESGRRVTLEYMLIAGINDSDAEMDALGVFCEGINCHVNIIPFNPVERLDLRASGRSTVQRWTKGLSSVGIPVSVRNSRGGDIHGACGQLKEVNTR